MSRSRAGWLLWIAAIVLLPLPYFIVAEGAVPVVRFALLAAIATSYAALIDGSGVAWPMAMILALHVVVSALVLGLAATVAASLIPARMRAWLVPALIVAGLVGALTFDIYRTPFDDTHARAGWTELFQ